MNSSILKTPNLPYWALKLAIKWLKKTLWTKIGILYQCAMVYLSERILNGNEEAIEVLFQKLIEQSALLRQHKDVLLTLSRSTIVHCVLFSIDDILELYP